MTLRIDDGHSLSLLAPFRVTGARARLPKRIEMARAFRRFLERRRVRRLICEIERVRAPHHPFARR